MYMYSVLYIFSVHVHVVRETQCGQWLVASLTLSMSAGRSFPSLIPLFMEIYLSTVGYSEHKHTVKQRYTSSPVIVLLW